MSLLLSSITMPSAPQAIAAAACGAFVSFALGLVGGGGSILAVPLMMYVVGLGNPHVAIGTAALAVAVNAYLNLIPHARNGSVRWGAAFAFAASGVLGATLGSSIGKQIDGHRLIVYFAVLMLFVSVLMLRGQFRPVCAATASPMRYGRVCCTGIGAGGLSGFFGIGGGFLVVPGLMLSAQLPILEAIGTSLFAVGSFGMTTAANYAMSGQVDWAIAVTFVAGGAAGGWIGARAAARLAPLRGVLNMLFAAMIVAAASYILYRSRQG